MEITKDIYLRVVHSKNEKNLRQPDLFEVEVVVDKFGNKIEKIQFSDFRAALQAFINRMD